MKKIFTAFFLTFFAATTQAEIVVIGNLDGIESLSFNQVENIFMGRTRSLPNGLVAQPIDQSALRAAFYEKLTARPIEQIDAYWARITFTGQASKPEILPSDDIVLARVGYKIKGNENAIGYIDRKSLNNTVRVLLMLN
jgi:ABC-type phosphate transport system substrate-binding protein